MGACPGLPLGFAPLKLASGSAAWEPVGWQEEKLKSAQAAAPIPDFLSSLPQAYSSVAPCQHCCLTGWQSLLGQKAYNL